MDGNFKFGITDEMKLKSISDLAVAIAICLKIPPKKLMDTLLDGEKFNKYQMEMTVAGVGNLTALLESKTKQLKKKK